MMTVNEVSKLTGVSIRTLQYYDKIGLLHPAKYSESGYRLYDDTALEKLQQILLFRELEFPLKDIKVIMDSPDFDRSKALEQQITLLTLKKEHLENLICLARGIKTIGVKKMDFSAFDTSKMDEYAAQAKASWGNTPEYHEYEEKAKGRTKQEEQDIGKNMMQIFTEFGTMIDFQPDSEKVQTQVKKLQDYITENFYTCSNDILNSLGNMYAGGGDFTTNIDNAGGAGTAEFVSQAIKIYCRK
ncbi:MAG: MerR family transcriptional regulator [Lachnospiraceae bacterium]|nr:MerR family transcriptional regulator [Lachnospiraceae bacterium]